MTVHCGEADQGCVYKLTLWAGTTSEIQSVLIESWKNIGL